MRIRFLSLLLSLSFSCLTYSQNMYVNSAEDFYIHTRNHVSNVNRMVDEVFDLIRKNPEKWGPVFNIPKGMKLDENLKRDLKEYMSLHDEAKLNTNADFLKQHNLKRPVISELYEEFGGLAKKEKVDLVNRVDGTVGQDFFSRKNMHAKDWRREFFAEFEHFTDGIERGENPVTPQEMGRRAYKESGRPLFKIENNRPAGPVKLSVMYEKMQEAGVVGTTPETSLKDIPGAANQRNKLPPSEVRMLQNKAEIAKHFEDRYPKIAVHFDTLKERYTKLFAALEKAGINQSFFQEKGLITKLDDFARFDLIDKYEKAFGPIEKIDDPDLSEKFRKFFFQDPAGKKILLSRASSGPMNYIPKSMVKVQKVNYGIPKKALNFSECGNLFESIPIH